MARYQRWNALLDLLPGDGQLTVAEAAQALSVSEATIRRDLDQLAKQQLVTRTRGGATAGHVSYDLPLRYKTARHAGRRGTRFRRLMGCRTVGGSLARCAAAQPAAADRMAVSIAVSLVPGWCHSC